MACISSRAHSTLDLTIRVLIMLGPMTRFSEQPHAASHAHFLTRAHTCSGENATNPDHASDLSRLTPGHHAAGPAGLRGSTHAPVAPPATHFRPSPYTSLIIIPHESHSPQNSGGHTRWRRGRNCTSYVRLTVGRASSGTAGYAVMNCPAGGTACGAQGQEGQNDLRMGCIDARPAKVWATTLAVLH